MGIAGIGDTGGSCFWGVVFGEHPPAGVGTAGMLLGVVGISAVGSFPAMGGMGLGIGSILVAVATVFVGAGVMCCREKALLAKS